MVDLTFVTLKEKLSTPDEVWNVVDRIPNDASTHWGTFVVVLGSIHATLNDRHPQGAHDIALAWASRSPRFTRKGFDAKWSSLSRSPMNAVGMSSLVALARPTSERDEGELELRAEWDMLRQACAAVAGKLRSQWLAEQVKASGEDLPLTSAMSGVVVEPYECRAVYRPGQTLDDVVLAFARGMGRMPRDFNLKRGDTGGGRFADLADVEQFTDCHNAVATLAIATTGEAGAMRNANWASVYAELTRLQKELRAVAA